MAAKNATMHMSRVLLGLGRRKLTSDSSMHDGDSQHGYTLLVLHNRGFITAELLRWLQVIGVSYHAFGFLCMLSTQQPTFHTLPSSAIINASNF